MSIIQSPIVGQDAAYSRAARVTVSRAFLQSSRLWPILFAEKDEQGDTHFRPVRANEYGGIEEWPKGFFDQTASEAQEILRAAVKKRKAAGDKKTEKSEQRGVS